MKLLISAAICLAAIVLPSCVDPNYYPPPSENFRARGPQADRLRADGRLSQNDRYDRNNRDDRSNRYDRNDSYDQDYDQRRDQVQEDRVPRRDEYPTATRTANPNQVLSPYKPFNVIDVEGFRTGQLAKDPSNGEIFRIP